MREILRLSQLTEGQKQEVRRLEGVCRNADGLRGQVFLENEWNADPTAPCFYLAYQEGVLAGFLASFFPTWEEGELTALVHPRFRRKGLFRRLYQEAGEDLRQLGVGRAVLVLEPVSPSGTAALAHFPTAVWLRSEYQMTSREAAPPLPEGFSLAPLEPATRAGYLQVRGGSAEEESFAGRVMASQERQGYLLSRAGEPVGVFDLEEQESQILLCGVMVAESQRRRGYGRVLVRCAQRRAFALGKPLVLEVDSENPAALKLYQSCGFEKDFQMDYYAMPPFSEFAASRP